MKDYQEISMEVRACIAEALQISSESILESDNIADLSQDSIQLFELLLAFEKKYEIHTTYDDIVRLHTVGDIIAYIQRAKYSV